jgi:quinolinate synthase
MLSTGGMLQYAADAAVANADPARPRRTAIVATEIGMLHPLREAAPEVTFLPANRAAVCQFMKMITLPKLRDALRDLSPRVQVPADLAERARLPIERMVSIS